MSEEKIIMSIFGAPNILFLSNPTYVLYGLKSTSLKMSCPGPALQHNSDLHGFSAAASFTMRQFYARPSIR
jgi:hypothetical protein